MPPAPELGATAGLVDTVAAAAQQHGEVYLLLDQFEEYFLYQRATRASSTTSARAAAPPRPARQRPARAARRRPRRARRVRRPHPRTLREHAPPRPARPAEARAAILGPLARYSELAGGTFHGRARTRRGGARRGRGRAADLGGDGLPARRHVEAPYLQLVLERLWDDEARGGFARAPARHVPRGSAARAPIVREHVQGTLERLPSPSRRRRRGWCASSSRRRAPRSRNRASDLAGLRRRRRRRRCGGCSSRLGRERIVRGVNGMQGGPSPLRDLPRRARAAPPRVAGRATSSRASEIRARRQHRRLLAIMRRELLSPWPSSPLVAVLPSSSASDARTEARHAHGGALAGRRARGHPDRIPQVERRARVAGCAALPRTADRRRPALEPRSRCASSRNSAPRRRHCLRGVRPAPAIGFSSPAATACGPLQDRSGSLDPGVAAAASADRCGLEPGRPALRNG